MNSFDFRDWESQFSKGNSEETAHAKRLGCSASLVLWPAALFLLFIFAGIAKGFYTEWLWFDSLGYGGVYTSILKTKILLFLLSAFIFCLLFVGNLLLATRLLPQARSYLWPLAIVTPIQKVTKWSLIAGTSLFALIFGMVAQANWEVVLQYFNAQPFGISDPVFNKEVSFYVFALPFLQLVRGWFLGVLILTFFSTASIYAISYYFQNLRFDFARPVLAHIYSLLIAILGLFAWNYRLGIWELVFSKRGVAFGASYADIHAKMPAQWILLAIGIIFMSVFLISIFRRDYRWPLYSLGGWVAAVIIIGGIYPGIVQRFQVQPNEFEKEQPYIENNIKFTREAFALNRIEEKRFPAEPMPTVQDISQNRTTLNNIRLWDPRPLKDTYNHIQSIRLYYDFNDVDVGRYRIDGQYRQVMLSARELSVDKLTEQAQTWVNRQLQFTHGYGLTLNAVNELSPEGQPLLLIKDIPPKGIFNVERPEIYFGEKTNHYVIIGTRSPEFDYPMGDQNIYSNYQGKDGVSIGGSFRRFLYAWQFGDFNIVISNELTSNSKILYYRNIKERVRRLAPFLMLDSDPYLVLAEGRLFWIQDAYTITSRYPYSQPLTNGINYLRNSVKVVIDAYNGSVNFYITDPSDALIRTYQSIFPQLFLPAAQMPEPLRAHLRYPIDMFNIQAQVYQSYHMQNARVFYNKEDLWATPKEFYAGQEQLMEPYYIIMRLPGEEKEEFLLMLPFTPKNKSNQIGWLAARSDGENYGQLLAYQFPKEKLVYGPSQIENRIQQDTVITEQLALWSRGGSRVIRGNLLVIPLGNSNLYVEPIFLQAEGKGLPELKRIIVVAGDKMAMRGTLDESISAIFGAALVSPRTGETAKEPEKEEKLLPQDVATLVNEALQHYNRAQEYLKVGDWSGYGKEQSLLKEALARLSKLTPEDK